jgi:ABC-type nitrate/sulfonate/bicarbonate transport system substrate-binding protein
MMKKIFNLFFTGLFFVLVISCSSKKYPDAVNISYVESPFNLQIMVMKDKGLLEKAFAEKNVEVKWHDINSGAEQTQAMAARSLDIASVINSTSVILANAAGNRVEVAGVVSRPKNTFALLVKPEGPASIKELKGKTIAGPKGTTLHQMLVAALVKEGLTASDVNFVQLGLPEARTALISGRVDGALQAASLIIRGKEAGLNVLFTADGYCTPLLFTAVRPGFAKDYPELLKIYLDVQKNAYDWIIANTKEAVAIGAKYQKISDADGLQLYNWSGMAQVLEQADIPALKADVEFLLENKMISQSVEPQDFILPSAYGK